MRILFPDFMVEGEPTTERRVAGADVQLDIHRARHVDEIPESVWRAADAVICYIDMPLRAAAANLLERCKLIVRAGVGFDQIDLRLMGERGIAVCNTPDYGTTDVADMAIAMMLALARGVVSFDHALHEHVVNRWNYKIAPANRRLRGQRFGVIGMGRIGTAAALRAQAFGMSVAFYDPYRPTGTELSFNFQRMRTLGDLLASCDVVSIHCPLTDETRNLIDDQAVAQMKPGMILINTARGPICDPAAILAGLKSGALAAAGLDVLPQEPPDPAMPLLRAWQAREPWIEGRLLLAPHAAWYSPSAYEDIRSKSMETALLYLREGTLRDCVNAQFLQR